MAMQTTATKQNKKCLHRITEKEDAMKSFSLQEIGTKTKYMFKLIFLYILYLILKIAFLQVYLQSSFNFSS